MTGGHSGGGWAAGVLSGKETLSGASTTGVVRPNPPSFAEPQDEASRAELPKALQGGGAAAGAAKKSFVKEPVTTANVNQYTQEKMRGDCYVRLLIKPEEHAARKIAVPYSAQTFDPDVNLAAKEQRPNIVMPPKPPVIGPDGELLEDEEFTDFERNDVVIFSFLRHNRYEAVQSFIEQDSQTLEARDEAGNILLHVACQNKNRRIVKLLLKSGISVNIQNTRGNTPLHYCYQYGFTDLAEYLVSHGANDAIPNASVCLPFQGVGKDEDPLNAAQKGLRTG